MPPGCRARFNGGPGGIKPALALPLAAHGAQEQLDGADHPADSNRAVTLIKTATVLGSIAFGVFGACGQPRPEVDPPVWNTLRGDPPVVIAHRGASALRPPHTLEAYDLGIALGADYIEPDLVLTMDDVLICRHDRYLSTTTNVADHPEFADRQVFKNDRLDWWVEDFTLAEIETLRARQNDGSRSTEYDDRFRIPTFADVIELARRRSVEEGRTIGIYPEPKRAAGFAALGKDLPAAVVAALETAGWSNAGAPVVVQSFEPPVLRELSGRIDVPLVQLMSSEDDIDLRDVPAYADGVGASRTLLVADDGATTDFVERAHALDLFVHVWTLSGDRDTPDGLGPEADTRRMFELGVDGVFADDPGQAVRVRAERR